jgi:phenylpropionate dioxygenase-like ring-hydroxylating dioxygenase large terminal subunit
VSEEPFLRNQWYVAARASEVGRRPFARMICGEPLLFYRRQDGGVTVLSDRCPHRQYPLSRGQLDGDDVECGYHGLRFGPTGACTLIPAQKEIPHGFGVRAYPCIERNALIHVWMGQASKADATLIPDFIENDGPGWCAVPDYLHIEANWQLIIDNLLDLTHLTFVHKTTLASRGIQENPLKVTVEGDRVFARREMHDVEPAPIFTTMRRFKGNIDRFQNITFLPPSHIHIRLEACPTGVADDPNLVHHVVLNHLTPETERTTHYFWSISRRMRTDDPRVSDILHGMNRTAFDEDVTILRLQQKMIDTGPAPEPLVNLEADVAVNAARRIIRRLYRAEAEAR